ncbi:MAG: hypothetical protein LUE92_09170 [Clostridiales bacterium]|nr:hypothetical protein [Clostridiales bacterium]
MNQRDVAVELQSEMELACMEKQGEQEPDCIGKQGECDADCIGKQGEIESDFMELRRERELVCAELRKNSDMEILWKALQLFENVPFYTSRKLMFRYTLKGGEMFVDRKSKSITRSSIEMAYKKAVEMEGKVSGPKKLGVFGASYLYPVFIRLGVIEDPGYSAFAEQM